MKISNIRNKLSLLYIHAGFHHAETEWCYKNVVSPFSRLFLFTGGRGAVYMNKKKYELTEGDLFLIPRFTFHNYECDDFLDHYYICFFDEMIGGRSLFDTTNVTPLVKAKEVDWTLMKRFVQLNDDCAITEADPKIYDNKKEIHAFNLDRTDYNLASEIESSGILLQLFSRFIADTRFLHPEYRNQYERLDLVINHIQNHLDRRITVGELADKMCISTDHFSRIFRKVIGLGPNKYIQFKRIERAQTMLLTSRLSIKEVAETVGIPNLSQFSKLFSKQTGHSPREYRETPDEQRRKTQTNI